MSSSSAPSPIEVVFRRVRLPFASEPVPKHWYAESVSLTHFFNALSAVFPDGEKYFIDAVRAFEDGVGDPQLRAQVREFVRQEGHHTHQHRLVNGLVEAQGLPLERCAAIARDRVLDRSRRRDSPRMQLAMTCAFEHFTALMGDWLLRRGDLEMHATMGPLWLWHAVEETEHKAVAFDVYRATGGTYWMRVRAMLRVTLEFLPTIHRLQLLLMRADGARVGLRDLLFCARYLYGKGGFIRALLPGYLRYFRRDFHPWQHDNSELIADWAAHNARFVVRPTASAA